MSEEIKFTAAERRILELPQDEKQIGPEAKALRQLIDVFPFILTAAEYNYDRDISEELIHQTAIRIQSEHRVGAAIEKYKANKSKEKSP
jgi:hypothetical protein